MEEIWKDIPGYEGYYQISNLGRVKRLKSIIFVIDSKQRRKYYRTINEKILSQFYDDNGYLTVNIFEKRTRVHRLVAKTFIPLIEGKTFVNHKDGNKANNKVENLEWCTNRENIIHAIKTNLMDISYLKECNKKVPVLMLDDNYNIIKRFDTISSAFAYFNMKYRGSITEVCQGKRKHFKGYRWKYDI